MPRKTVVRVRKKQDGFHKLEFKSKEDFLKGYEKYDEESARNCYMQVLSQLERSVATGNISYLKYLSSIVDNISSVEDQTTLKDFHDDTNNPLQNTNLVILACKYNQPEILKYLLSNGKILENLSIHKGKNILHDDEDETSHSAFYYAIRSGNVDLLEILIKWSKRFYGTRLDKLDEILSITYEELKLKNVALTDKMEFSVENKLLNLRFFSDNFRQNQSTTSSLDNIKKRMDLVLENINLLATHSGSNVDEIFLFTVKFIAQNIHILKRQLKIMYDRLPWEEIEFCLICFVSLHTRQQEINLFYHATLDKRKLLQYLEEFAKKFEEVKETIERMSIDKLTNIPNINREKVVAEIIRNNPQFEELYNNYHQIRDIYSLEKIGSYINLASSVDPGDREGQLVITRVLQIIGEYLKNTLESPKLSSLTSDLILLKLSKNTRKVITDLRNSLSHSFSLFKRTEIEENSNIKFYTGVQSDLKKVGEAIIDILYDKKIKVIKFFLNKIIDSENVDEIREVVKALQDVKVDNMDLPDFRILNENEMFENTEALQNCKRNEMDFENFRMTEHEKIEKLIKEVRRHITDKTDLEEALFLKIDNIIDFAKRKFENIKDEYYMSFVTLKCFEHVLNGINSIDDNIIRGIKYRARETLKNMSSQIEPHNLKEIAKLSAKIFHSVMSRKINEDLDQINILFFEIFYIAEFQIDSIKWIEEFRSKLNEKRSTSIQKHRKTYCTKEQNSTLLALKLTELKQVLRNNLLSAEKICSCIGDKKLQAVVEMLLLDIMSILSITNCYLENNLFYLDDNYPLLVGKSLRNHLAHNNALYDILLSKPSTTIILNAKKITEENIITTKRKIGKMISDNPLKLKGKHNQDLKIITYQRKMYTALEEGNLELLQECLKKGADISARSINSWTALHYAAKGPNLEVVKFILESNVQVDVEDQNGQNPLYIAAAYGNANIVEYLIKKAGLSVNKEDRNLKTPLHIASQKGYTDTVEVLLKFNANSAAKDTTGLSALHYAIRNNHFHIVKILLKTDVNVDLNETAGGFTPLHEASEFGHLEIVTYLLQKRADVNAKNDRNRTPLHAAAFNGHLDVTKALISESADVNSRVIDGCTPLHYALENGHEEIANILLSYGAKVNISDKTWKYTPLHYAAKFGHENTVMTLLKYGADATVMTIGGITPLHFAAENGHLGIITALLKQDVDIHAKDIFNATPLHYAADSGQKEAAALLLKSGATVDAKNDHYCTPLYVAVLKGHKDIVNLLIQNKANVNEKANEGNTILHAAAINGCKEVTDILIKHKAEVNVRNSYSFTPLHVASEKGHKDIVILLLENEGEVNTRTFNGFTPLHTAIIEGHKYIVELLIKNKSNVNAKTSEDETPLHLAIETGHREITEILIVSGADVNEMNGSNFTTPLLTAVQCNNIEIVKTLLDNGAFVDDGPLSLAVMAGYRDIVEILIKNKDRVDFVDVENITLLHIAVKTGQIDIVKMLMEKRADVNAKTIDNVTPLHFAVKDDHEEVAEYLIANGANVNAKSNEGTTPLHSAAVHGHSGVIKVLLDKKGDVTVKDNKNRSPLELTVENGHLKETKMLLQHKRIDINAKGNYDWTLLHIASQGNNLNLVKYLVTEGANINSKDVFGSKPIHIAVMKGFKDAVEYFLSKGCSINDLGAVNQTLLHYAVIKNNLEIMTYLIDKEADVNVKDANGLAPIHIAVTFGYMKAIEILLKNGAAYNITDNFGRQLSDMTTKKDVFGYLISTKNFFEAVKNNNVSDIKKYIEAGVFVDVKNTDGVTPLYFAAWKGHEEVLSVLLQNNANPNTVNNKGIYPLHYASKFSHVNVVKALLSHGAIFNAVSNKGKTPLAFSTDRNIVNLFKIVRDSFKSIRNGSSRFIYDLNNIKDVVTIKAIMNACNREGETLIVAAILCNFPKVEQLKNILQDDAPDAVDRALTLVGYGNHQNAICILNKVYEKKKYILGPNNPGTLEIERHIAVILYKQGNYKDALDKLETIYQKQKKTLGLSNEDTLKTRSTLALVLYRQERNEEAFEIFQEVYQMQKEIIGSNHPDTLDTQFHMTLVLAAQGKHEEALSINRRIYEERKRKLGANSHTTIVAQNNIAMVLTKQGNYEQALEIYKDVLEKKKLLLGLHHADTLRTLQTMASILFQQKKYQEALEAHQEVISLQKMILGPNNPETLVTQYNLGILFFKQGKFANAFKVYTECFEKIKAVFEPTNPIVLSISLHLKVIKKRFQLEGSESSEIFSHLQDDMKIAIMNGDIQTIINLLKEGTDVNGKDSDGITLLHYAVSYEHKDIVSILLQNGADIFQVTNKGNTPLHIAVSKNNSKIVKVLLQHVQRGRLSSFINAKTTFDNTTALYVAAKNGSLNVVKILLKHGAIYDMENNEGKKPQNISTDQSVTILLKLIEELFKDAKSGNEELIKKLKSITWDEFLVVTNVRNNQGNTLLQVLITKKHTKIANKLSEMLRKQSR